MAKFTLSKKFKDKIKDWTNVAKELAANKHIKREILLDLKKGVSPVQGQTFKPYSQSYRDSIRNTAKKSKRQDKPYKKKTGLVDLKVTGALWKSLNTDNIGDRLIISFEDEKASYHNEGTDKMPRRAILPTEANEVFNRKIRKVIQTALKNAIRKIFKRS